MLILSTMLYTEIPLLADFNKDSQLNDWYVVDDGVMGGRSQGTFYLSEEGHAVFEGNVSLENNGGFSSVRHRFQQANISAYTHVVLRVKGDGKRYQFRVKTSSYDRHSYITYFQTSGEWETLKIPLADLYPYFRGWKLKMPNFPGEVMEEVSILVGNKKAEAFRLEIDRIGLE